MTRQRGDHSAPATPWPIRPVAVRWPTLVPESIPIIRAQIEARLRAIDEERAALSSALEALASVPETPDVARRVAAPGRRARRGENLAKILPIVAANPQARPRDIAAMTGVDARVVSATLSKLRRQGQLPER